MHPYPGTFTRCTEVIGGRCGFESHRVYVSYKEDILRLRDLGKSYNEIAKELGCAKSTVSYYCSPSTRRKLATSQRKRRNTPKKTRYRSECSECGAETSHRKIYCSDKCSEIASRKRKLSVRSTGKKKTCSICRKVKDLSRFGFDKNTRDGYMRQCSTCNSARVSNHKNKDQWISRPSYIRHGLTNETYSSLLISQNNSCLVCKREFNENLLGVVDHDHSCCSGSHSCGKCVRGILCSTCNQALGLIHDSVDTAENLVVYLKTQGKRTQ